MEHDDSEFKDVVMLALAVTTKIIVIFASIAIILLPHLNPKAVQSNGQVEAQESVIFEVSWDNQLDADVDLWVRAPGDTAVGYSNKGAVVCNLLRDDLGQLGDPLQINHEQTVCRGLVPDQEYTVNAHGFRGSVWPIDVMLQVTTKTAKGSAIQAFHASGRLDRGGDEITLANFKLDESGMLRPETIDTLYRPLRSYSAPK